MNGTQATHSCGHTHEPCSQPHKRSRFLEAAIIITGIALAVLGFFTAPEWFVGSFLVGVIGGVIRGIQLPEGTKNIKQVKGCSNDLLEVIMDEELPEGFSFGLAALTFACHIEHHPLPFVPLIGLATGYWTGRRIVDCGRQIKKWASPSLSVS